MSDEKFGPAARALAARIDELVTEARDAGQTVKSVCVSNVGPLATCEHVLTQHMGVIPLVAEQLGEDEVFLECWPPRMTFGDALELLKAGRKVARAGWNGKGMFLLYIEGSWTYTDGKSDNYPNLPFIAMKTATDEIVPWLASQTDMLAEDWSEAAI